MMFNILKNIIGYSGSGINNVDQYYVYASIVVVALIAVVGVDNILKFFRHMMPKNKQK